jgi:hypothetical protein
MAVRKLLGYFPASGDLCPVWPCGVVPALAVLSLQRMAI